MENENEYMSFSIDPELWKMVNKIIIYNPNDKDEVMEFEDLETLALYIFSTKRALEDKNKETNK